jgi:hypothetical protein
MRLLDAAGDWRRLARRLRRQLLARRLAAGRLARGLLRARHRCWCCCCCSPVSLLRFRALPGCLTLSRSKGYKFAMRVVWKMSLLCLHCVRACRDRMLRNRAALRGAKICNKFQVKFAESRPGDQEMTAWFDRVAALSFHTNHISGGNYSLRHLTSHRLTRII